MTTRVPFSIVAFGVLAVALSVPLVARAPHQGQTPQAAPPRPTAAPQAATPRADTFGPNVRVDVTLTDTAASNATPVRKSISLTVAANGRSSSVRSGVNVPVPSTTFGAAAAGGVNTIPITSYNYRTQGLSLDLREVEVRESQVRVGLTVEYSPLDDAEKPAPANTPISYSNFSQSFWLVLESGKPVIAVEASDPVPNRSRKLSIEVKATVLR